MSFVLAIGIGALLTSHLLDRTLKDSTDRKPVIPLATALIPELVEVPIHYPGSSGERVLSVGKFEVTIAQYNACVDDKACNHRPRLEAYKDENHPVTELNWLDATRYVNWLSAKTGEDYRLPLNSEWEVFAGELRNKKPKKLFDDPRMAWAADYANYGSRPPRRTLPVSRYKANAAGIHGIAGNVWEWTNTCWRKDGLIENEDVNCGGVRILQGLHKTYQSEFVRLVKPGGCSIGFAPSNIGLRVVREQH